MARSDHLSSSHKEKAVNGSTTASSSAKITPVGAGDELQEDANIPLVPSKAAVNHHDHTPGNGRFLFCALGVFISFFVFGIFQERITRGEYGKGERFDYTLSLVFVQCVVNAIYAKFAMRISKEPRDSTPRSLYGWCSLSYLAAMLSSNRALHYVNYPTQVLGKSCKPIPVMLLGVLLAHRRYPFRKYLFVLSIVVGVAIFLFDGNRKHSMDEQKELGFGEALLMFSLLMDGVTGAVQDRMRSSHKTRSNSMMMWMNIFSSLILFIAICFSGEVLDVISFVQRYPYALEHMMTFALCSAVGQYFIFLTVAEFGPLPCSIITTTRKFFTILLSVFVYSNPLTSMQWFGTFLVFVGLMLDIRYGKDRKH